jgi:hypothetical protein
MADEEKARQCSCYTLREPCDRFLSRVYENGDVVCHRCEHNHACHKPKPMKQEPGDGQ